MAYFNHSRAKSRKKHAVSLHKVHWYKKMGKKTVKNRQSFYKKRFLINFVKYLGSVGEAARATGIHRRTVYTWREGKEFQAHFEEAQADVLEIFEKEADRRAMSGVAKPVFYKGEECGAIQEYSDTLLIFRMKALAPEKYRERHEISGPGGGPLKSELNIIVRDTETKELMQKGIERTAGE